MTTTSTIAGREIWDGLDFMMEMFDAPRFPRAILTGASHKPHIVDSREQAMIYFKAALYEDCYLNAYGPGAVTPTHVMIDLDRESFTSDEELDDALKDTLQNIKSNIIGISGEYPIVIASGSGGYHIHVPLQGLHTPFQQMPEFEAFKHDQDLSSKFLRFAESRLSNNKADHHHSPSVRSCMFRVPGTINSKNKAKVRIVKGIENVLRYIALTKSLPGGCAQSKKSRPTTKFLNDFHAYLIQQEINDKIARSHRELRSLIATNAESGKSSKIWWIDQLLQVGIEDGRKNLLFWVLAPYLITVKRLDYDKAYSILEDWLYKCDTIRRLQPDRSSFRHRIEYCLRAAEEQDRKPIRHETFKEYYCDLYRRLFGWR